METVQISLPNSPDNPLLIEMCERLEAGMTVTMLFGGRSMLPMINGEGDKITLRPLEKEEACVPGEVYLFKYCNHFVIHRLMRIEGGVHVFRGDNCVNYERVGRENVLAKLMTVIQPNGNEIDCEGEWWHKRSKQVLRRKRLRTAVVRMLSPKARNVWSVLYFILLAVLMWAPLNGLGIPLNRFIFGLRLDHLLHASVFLLCPLFLVDWMRWKKWGILVVALLIGLFTEYVQYLLPYRGFDINDLVGNCIGNTLGWLALLPILVWHARRVSRRQRPMA